MLTHHPSPALLPWLTPGGTTQENDRNVCFDARLKARGDSRGPHSSHTKLAAKALHTTQGNLGNKQAGRAKSNFFEGLNPPGIIPTGNFKNHFRVYLFHYALLWEEGELLHHPCSLFGSWGLPTCCFQNLPFKGRRKTDGHKNTSEAKYTMQNHS